MGNARKGQRGPAGSSGTHSGAQYVFDRRMIPRVREYIAEQQALGPGKARIDSDSAADYLRRAFPRDYARKARAPFKATVERVLDLIRRLRGGSEEARLLAVEERRRSSMRPDDLSSDDSDSESLDDIPQDGKNESDEEEGAIEFKADGLVAGELSDAIGGAAVEGGVEGDTVCDPTKTPARGMSPVPMALDTPTALSYNPFAGNTRPSGVSGLSGHPTPTQVGGLGSSEGAAAPVTAPRTRPSKRRLDKSHSQRGDVGGSGGSSGASLITRPSVTFADVGGIESCLQEVRELIEWPLTHPEIYSHLGVEPPRGILLHGPPGCGKTMLANAIAGELEVPFLRVSAPEIVSGMSGESEAKIRDLFAQAVEAAPCLVFIDEIDAITPKRETAQREMERRMVAQLLTCMDGLSLENTGGRPVLVIGATNRPDSLDIALRRAGRFDREISIGVPDEAARARILGVVCSKLRLSGDFDFDLLGRKTPGYVGADLSALAKEAAVIAVNRIFHSLWGGDMPVETKDAGHVRDAYTSQPPTREGTPGPVHVSVALRGMVSDRLRAHGGPLSPTQLAQLSITMEDFTMALTKVQPSSKREGFATVPGVTWADVGALEDVRAELKMAILEPIRAPERFAQVGLSAPAGVLLYGPPGCGKTMLAKAIANESGANFISIKGPELLNKYVGESERAVRQVFQRAQASSPCVIFFDELDALCPRRGQSSDSHASERVVNQLLTEMDGLETRRQVFVIAATNRPDIIDPAMLRPGRLDKLLYVGLPTEAGRASILRTLVLGKPIAEDVDVNVLARDHRCAGMSGADLASLVREACVAALKEAFAADDARASISPETLGAVAAPDALVPVIVSKVHMEAAFRNVQPSVSEKDSARYSAMSGRLRRVRAHVTAGAVADDDAVKSAPHEPMDGVADGAAPPDSAPDAGVSLN